MHRVIVHCLLFGFLFCSGLSCTRHPDGSSEATESSTLRSAPSRATPRAASPPPQQESTKAEPSTAPTSPYELISGQALTQHIANSGKKATIVNAWASWCGPCKREFPMLVALRDSLSAQDVQVLFVSVDEEEARAAALDFAQGHGVSPPLLFAKRPLSAFKQAMHPRWPGMLPATFLFDSEGNVRFFWAGPVFEAELLPIIEDFLAGKDVDGVANVGLRKGKDLRY